MRCLPNSFPTYTFTRYGPVSPKFFAVSRTDLGYGMIFDNRGVPIWWIHEPSWSIRVMTSGNLLWFNGPSSQFEVHRLDGSLVRTLKAVGHQLDGHDLQFVPTGDHLVGSGAQQSHVDTSAYGGSSDATVKNAVLAAGEPRRPTRLGLEEHRSTSPWPRRGAGGNTPSWPTSPMTSSTGTRLSLPATR